ncbi:MAG: PhnA domain-containing protein [Saprospiraceae bacterium]|tara:strand:- start:1921 stop:2508 length:588 start_codon:yes stop_codon:yes gene_type:complete
MSISRELNKRSNAKCELCGNEESLLSYIVFPKSGEKLEEQIAICNTCLTQMEGDDLDKNHWRCLNDSMWNAEPAIQVVSYRMLHRLNDESWAQDAINMIYMEPDTMEWAQEGIENELEKIIHKDSNGNILENGDTITLIQDLNVKGAGFTAKRGAAMRRIRLVHDNPEHIEGKIDGQHIVLLTKYVKKQPKDSKS